MGRKIVHFVFIKCNSNPEPQQKHGIAMQKYPRLCR